MTVVLTVTAIANEKTIGLGHIDIKLDEHQHLKGGQVSFQGHVTGVISTDELIEVQKAGSVSLEGYIEKAPNFVFELLKRCGEKADVKPWLISLKRFFGSVSVR